MGHRTDIKTPAERLLRSCCREDSQLMASFAAWWRVSPGSIGRLTPGSWSLSTLMQGGGRPLPESDKRGGGIGNRLRPPPRVLVLATGLGNDLRVALFPEQFDGYRSSRRLLRNLLVSRVASSCLMDRGDRNPVGFFRIEIIPLVFGGTSYRGGSVYRAI